MVGGDSGGSPEVASAHDVDEGRCPGGPEDCRGTFPLSLRPQTCRLGRRPLRCPARDRRSSCAIPVVAALTRRPDRRVRKHPVVTAPRVRRGGHSPGMSATASLRRDCDSRPRKRATRWSGCRSRSASTWITDSQASSNRHPQHALPAATPLLERRAGGTFPPAGRPWCLGARRSGPALQARAEAARATWRPTSREPCLVARAGPGRTRCALDRWRDRTRWPRSLPAAGGRRGSAARDGA